MTLPIAELSYSNLMKKADALSHELENLENVDCVLSNEQRAKVKESLRSLQDLITAKLRACNDELTQ